MEEDILISVIIPIYNIEQYVERCICSVCNQTYSNLEIILVDDGSTDLSGKICDKYKQTDTRIKVVHKKNGGLVSARKVGAQYATGEYVIPVDGDDWIDNTRIANLYEKALIYNPEMVYLGGHYKEKEGKSTLFHGENINCEYLGDEGKKKLLSELVNNYYFLDRHVELAQWLWCVRTDIYNMHQQNVPDEISMGEDDFMTLSCLISAQHIIRIYEPSYHYLQRNNSITFSKKQWSGKHSYIFCKALTELLNMNKTVLENAVIQYCYHNIMLTNYGILLNHYSDYLFPYTEVKNNSNIVIYGAGNIGFQIVDNISKSDRFNLVAWVDKKADIIANDNIISINQLVGLEYDYIVIAILVHEIAYAAANDLINQGISMEKLVLMKSNEMKCEDIEAMLGKW